MIIFHFLSLAFVLYTIARADYFGMLWIREKRKTLNEKKLRTLHTQAWIGLGLMITTGLTLFWPMKEYLLTLPQFYIKMAFVVTLICNGFVVGRLQKKASTRTFSSLSPRERTPLFISGAVSTLSWIGAIIAAFFLLPD